MRRMLPLLILLFPALELWVLILVGKEIGALAAIALVALSTVAGLVLLRLRGLHIARGMQAELASGRIPSNPIADTFCLMAAGCLFLFPGFVSDALAVLLLIPFVRRALLAVFFSSLKAQGFQAQTVRFDASGHGGGTTWTCSTFEAGSSGAFSREPREWGESREPRGAAVVIDCEPETARGGEEKDAPRIEIEPDSPDGAAGSPAPPAKKP